MDLEQAHYVAIQPYNRTSQFFNLADFRMKEVLENHYKTIEKHSDKLLIDTVYCVGMGPTEYVQIVRFQPEDLILFHEFMNDLSKVNSPFMNQQETVIGVGGVKDYPSVFGVKNLEEEVHPEIRDKFEQRGDVFITKQEITAEDMKKEQKFLHEKGYKGPVWEYPIDTYGWGAFQEAIKPKIRRFADQKRLVSILYLNHPPSWWTLPDHERGQIMMKHKTLLKKYITKIDRDTAKLQGMSTPSFVSIFEYPTENTQIYNEMINDTMKIDAPYLEINQTFTGISGIGDYWLDQLKDIELKDVDMTDFSKSRWGYKA